MLIVYVDNIQIQRYGLTKAATGRKLFNGMIRNNWKVCEYSERDIAKFETPLNIKPLGVRAASGGAFYHEHFSGQRIVKFMVECALGLPYSHDYIWQQEIYR
jgi:hypothetical protein